MHAQSSPSSPVLAIRFPASFPDSELPDRLAALLDDHDPVAIDEGAVEPDGVAGPPVCWHVYFAAGPTRDRAAAAVAEAFGGAGLTVSAVEIPSEDWAVRSQAAVRAIWVGSLVVAPPWDLPDVPAASRIVIKPSTGFGTGHHATTRLCLRALQALDLAGRVVLDLGAGSGILAIAAVKRGAAGALAVDCDPDALASAAENVDLNDVGDQVTLRLADLATLSAAGLPPADVVLANLTAGVLARHADAIRGTAVPGGTIVVSGVLRDQADGVTAAFEADGVRRLVGRDAEDEWVSLTLRNEGVTDSRGPTGCRP
jgi:ribosomal protein L11 methyltransferase